MSEDFDPETVRQMKESSKLDMIVGGAELAAQAFKARLVDEFHLILAPVVLGGGKPALPRHFRLNLELQEERRFENGILYLDYRIVQ